jgi:glyoxylase-like metal-dependent hydrolase (beta-lactamase superfamily II)
MAGSKTGDRSMREILPDVFTWSRFSEPHGYDFNGYLVVHDEGNLCIDPVLPDDADLDAIARLGVAKIVLTNRNHTRASNAIRDRTQAPVWIHPDDAPHARGQGTPVDGELRVGDRIGPLDIVGAPGKSAGEVVLHWPSRRLLFVGDAVVGNPPGRCALLRDKVMDDPERLRRSVLGLLALDFDALLFGDGTPILREAKTRLDELVQTFGP